MKDSVEHTGKAFLGLTLNCAMCHDHKYDPITQEDYFAFGPSSSRWSCVTIAWQANPIQVRSRSTFTRRVMGHIQWGNSHL